MTFDNVITGMSIILAIGAFYLSIKKGGSEVNNSDADTISQMFKNFKEQEARYKELRAEFDNYRTHMDGQFAVIASENVKLRAWAKNLVRQLEQANIVPIKFDE
jgi:hypothetical protein